VQDEREWRRERERDGERENSKKEKGHVFLSFTLTCARFLSFSLSSFSERRDREKVNIQKTGRIESERESLE